MFFISIKFGTREMGRLLDLMFVQRPIKSLPVIGADKPAISVLF